ncbi:hypothetical protein [Shewanella donghaensis]|uniref:hypothetical protein n=1 Tax=Shewanella donghaensis TaxID=238836 RepID=UPI0013159703|nr:hypothetical protein [Shewanella donghaensis]
MDPSDSDSTYFDPTYISDPAYIEVIWDAVEKIHQTRPPADVIFYPNNITTD